MFLQQRTKITLIFLILFILISFIQADSPEVVNYENLFETKDVNLTGKGLNHQVVDDIHNFQFGENASLELNGDIFENIKYNSISPGYMKLNTGGELVGVGFFTNEKGGEYTIKGTTVQAPPNSYVFYGKEGIIKIVSREDSKIEKETLFEDSSIPVEFTATENSRLRLPNGHIIRDGSIIKNSLGQYYFNPGNPIQIDRTLIFKSSGEKAFVFFDGQAHEGFGTYYSFGEDQFFMKSDFEKNSKNVVHFLNNNPYLLMEGGDEFSFEMNEGEFSILNKKDGKIPKVRSMSDDIKISNNGYEFAFMGKDKKKHLYGYYTISPSSSTPMRISFYDKKNNPVLGGVSNPSHEILVDNFNRYGMIPKNTDEEFFIKKEGIDTKFSSRIRYNTVNEKELQILTGNKIRFSGSHHNYHDELSEGDKSLMLGKIRDYWATLTPETKNSVDKIYLLDSEEMNRAMAYVNLQDVYLQSSDINLENFKHEFGHIRHLGMKSSEYSEFNEEWYKIFGIKDRFSFTSLFEKESNNKYVGREYKDLDYRDFPKEGVLRIYGLYNQKEHVATYVEEIRNEYFLGKLIDPDSPTYDKRYRDGIDLLHKYKFISDEEYNNILKEAGLK